MSRRRQAPRQHSSHSGVWLLIGLAFGGALIIFSILSATSQMANDAAPAGDVTLGTPLSIAAPTRAIGDLSALPQGTVTHVDVVYFHRTQRCTACQNAGRYTRQTVETFFAPHLQRGVLSFRELDVEKRENAAVARKYDASGSSLYVGVLVNGVEYLCPIDDIWFYTNNKILFIDTLTRQLNALVGGV